MTHEQMMDLAQNGRVDRWRFVLWMRGDVRRDSWAAAGSTYTHEEAVKLNALRFGGRATILPMGKGPPGKNNDEQSA